MASYIVVAIKSYIKTYSMCFKHESQLNIQHKQLLAFFIDVTQKYHRTEFRLETWQHYHRTWSLKHSCQQEGY